MRFPYCSLNNLVLIRLVYSKVCHRRVKFWFRLPGEVMDIVSQRRGKKAAILGLVFQVVLSTVMLVVWVRTESLSAMTAFWFVSGGLALWEMAGVLFYCRPRDRQEAVELEEIASGASTGTIFDAQDGTLRPAAHRLAWITRW